MDDGLVCPVGILAPTPKKEVSPERQRAVFGDREIGRVEAVVRVQIEHAGTRHDEVAVFLDNHCVRLQTPSEGLDHVEVEPKAIGVGHQFSLADNGVEREVKRQS